MKKADDFGESSAFVLLVYFVRCCYVSAAGFFSGSIKMNDCLFNAVLTDIQNPHLKRTDLHFQLCAVFRISPKLPIRKPLKVSILLLRKRIFQLTGTSVQRTGTTHFPAAGVQPFNLRFLTQHLVIVKITYQLFHQIRYRNDSAHSAIFVQNYCKVICMAFHLAEQLVCLEILVDKIGRMHCVFHDRFFVPAIQPEKSLALSTR